MDFKIITKVFFNTYVPQDLLFYAVSPNTYTSGEEVLVKFQLKQKQNHN